MINYIKHLEILYHFIAIGSVFVCRSYHGVNDYQKILLLSDIVRYTVLHMHILYINFIIIINWVSDTDIAGVGLHLNNRHSVSCMIRNSSSFAYVTGYN